MQFDTRYPPCYHRADIKPKTRPENLCGLNRIL